MEIQLESFFKATTTAAIATTISTTTTVSVETTAVSSRSVSSRFSNVHVDHLTVIFSLVQFVNRFLTLSLV